jgi:hypothetical protein
MKSAAVTQAVSPDYDLLSGGADLLEVALLAARCSAAARRAAGGGAIDSDDELSLNAIAQLLEASAKVVGSFGPQHPATAPPSGAFAARVDVAIDAVLHDADLSDDVEHLSMRFHDLANQVKALISQPSSATATPLIDILAALTSSVLRETGHVGEITSTF